MLLRFELMDLALAPKPETYVDSGKPIIIESGAVTHLERVNDQVTKIFWAGTTRFVKGSLDEIWETLEAARVGPVQA